MQQFIDNLINGPARYALSHNIQPGWSLIFILVIFFIEITLAFFTIFLSINALKYFRAIFSFILRLILKKNDDSYKHLELTLPSGPEGSIYQTEQIHTILGDIHKHKRLIDILAGRKITYTLELVSNKNKGIRYIIHAPSQSVEAVKRTLFSFIPHIKISMIDDYLDVDIHSKYKCAEIRLSRNFTIPLNFSENIREHDTITYVIGHMRDLAPNELIIFQMVVTPVFSHTHPYELRYIQKILRNLILSRNTVFTKYDKDAQKLDESIRSKLNQPLFEVSIRILVTSSDAVRIEDRFDALLTPLTLLTTEHQSLIIRNKIASSHTPLKNITERKLTPNLIKSKVILSSHEMANLYHFPLDHKNSDNLLTSFSPTLSPPLSIVNHTDYDVRLGESVHRGIHIPIGLTLKEREKHIFIIGGTGNGKTTLLQYSLIQDIKNGKGVALIDPHGDLAESLLHTIPKERLSDVIYFNPDDLEYPIGLNLLELTSNSNDEELLREKDLIVESVISMFRKIFSEDDSGGHRVEYILRNTIHTALTVENATIFTIYDLLNDPDYRKDIVNKLDNKNLKDFWRNEMGKAGGMQQVKMTAGITSKIGRFLFSAPASRILGQSKSTINFDDILDGKILICNFSKGLIGEDTSELFGIAVLAKLQLSSLRRARVAHKDRIPFYLYVDEFQNFATPSFTQMLSESRKYKLFLIMAEQSTSQQADSKMVDIILANVGTVISFRSGNPNDERKLLPYFYPFLSKGNITNLPPYNFYIRISATKIQEAFSGQTVIANRIEKLQLVKRIIILSRKNYSTNFTKYKRRNMTSLVKTEKKKVGVRRAQANNRPENLSS